MTRRRRHVIHGLLDQLKASFDGSVEQSDGVTEAPRMIESLEDRSQPFEGGGPREQGLSEWFLGHACT